MKKINCTFENNTKKIYTDFGSSPELLKNLCDWLIRRKDDIVSIDIAFYLFNNTHFLETLESLANCGIKIKIYSIPLEGYDTNKPISIYKYDTEEFIGKFSKFDCAKIVYEKIKEINNPNLKLFIMPHMYIRSEHVNPFSRGPMPYSLHIKSFMVEFKSGNICAGLTSSNFAVRDEHKIELACSILLNKNEKEATLDFYKGLRENSIEIGKFDECENYTHYKIKTRNSVKNIQTGYIAPFYNNSPVEFENFLIELINATKNRIVIAAQHVSAYDYSYSEREITNNNYKKFVKKPGILKYVLQKANSGIDVSILSQTYADGQYHPGIRSPQNTKSFIKFIDAAQKTKNCSYYVNSKLHAKYIIIDDMAILTTCNFTPSQFIYLPNVNIEHFYNIPNVSYSGIFCEFGAYYVTDNIETIQTLEAETQEIINLEDTKKFI